MTVQSRLVIQRLEREGWVRARISGSHHQFVHPQRPGQRVTVVHPKKDLNIKTLRSIMKQAGWEHL